jgi:O-antigen ligase
MQPRAGVNMIDTLWILAIILVGLVGLISGMYVFRSYSTIIRSQNRISFPNIIILAVISSISGASILPFIILFYSYFIEQQKQWSLETISSVVSIGLVIGVIVFVGSLYQFFTSIKLRDLIHKRYKNK